MALTGKRRRAHWRDLSGHECLPFPIPPDLMHLRFLIPVSCQKCFFQFRHTWDKGEIYIMHSFNCPIFTPLSVSLHFVLFFHRLMSRWRTNRKNEVVSGFILSLYSTFCCKNTLWQLFMNHGGEMDKSSSLRSARIYTAHSRERKKKTHYATCLSSKPPCSTLHTLSVALFLCFTCVSVCNSAALQ